MNVLIDADGCPVTDLTVSRCRACQCPCTILCDTAHRIHREGAETLVLDKGADSVDFAIANRIKPGDLVITQDYGLACMCLARGARVLHQDGWEYTPQNIDGLLELRHQAFRARRSGKHIPGMKKRTENQNIRFRAALDAVLQNCDQG